MVRPEISSHTPGVRSIQCLQSGTLADFTGPVVVAIVVGLLGAVLLMTVYKAAIVVLTSFVDAILVWGGFSEWQVATTE